MKILAIAPHPDDEVLGVGGTLIDSVHKGHEVIICIVTSIYYPRKNEDLPRYKKNEKQIRMKEAIGASKVIGAKEVIFMDLPNNKLDHMPHAELNEKMRRIF